MSTDRVQFEVKHAGRALKTCADNFYLDLTVALNFVMKAIIDAGCFGWYQLYRRSKHLCFSHTFREI